VQHLLCFWLSALGQVVQDVAGFVHPASLLGKRSIFDKSDWA
jgi:hypothetical protein